MDRVDYGNLLWTTLAEFPGILVTLWAISRLGRRATMCLLLLLSAAALCVLFNCSASRTSVTLALLTVRAVSSGVFQAAYVYTPEVYPTALRSVGVGTCSTAARVGAAATPYVAQVLMKQSLALAAAVYIGFSVAAAAVCMSLPVETRGKDMAENRARK